jgi:hypothetical protein
MTRLMGAPARPGVGARGALGVNASPPGQPAHLPAFMPTVVALVGLIRQELEANLPKLLSLNPSRREAMAQHLDRLAGIAPGPSASSGVADAGGGLRRWIQGPRTPAQNAALAAFFEELALVTVGQAIVLKAWSDRGLRAWKEEDLGRLNWALSNTLKPHVPLDREGWQITKNLYSWYNPSPALQRDLWSALEGWRITDEGPELLAGLLRMARPAPSEGTAAGGYDPRFFDTLWRNLDGFGFDPAAPSDCPMRRKRVVFSPTLRDGTMVRTGPVSLSWVGLEEHPFQLLVAELVQLWWGPAAPPVWAIGTGLEVHSRDQLTLALGSPKPSLFSRIGEMEAADLAFVLEERLIKGNHRSADAQRFREQAEALPYFRKLRAPGTTLGDLQACVALSKLRAGGLLFWARDEALGSADGAEALGFLLERSRVVCEWDFSAVSHSLPVTRPLFPKHLYLLARDPDVQSRLSHRPLRVTLEGQIRSHVEVPLVLGDALQATAARGTPRPAPRGNWQLHVQQSPTPQKEWAERWPDPAEPDALRSLEELRASSLPLAAVTTVRPTPQGDPERDHAWTVPRGAVAKGLWVQATTKSGSRRLAAAALPAPGQEAKGAGFFVLVPDESWIAPVVAYLESAQVTSWLEHHAERRGDRWHLSEQVVKFIPVPRTLLQSLGGAPAADAGQAPSPSFALPLPGEWEKLASEVPYQPKLVRERLAGLAEDETGRRIRAALFVRAARAIEHLKGSQARLLSLVSDDGRVRWRELFDILPKSQFVPAAAHSSVRLSGTLPNHLPVSRIERVKIPAPGFLFATETGFHLHLASESPRILEMLAEQLEGLRHPTWGELTQYLRLPRHLDVVEATAADVLRSHGEQAAKLRDLCELLSACRVF